MTDPWTGHDNFCNCRMYPEFVAEQDVFCNCRTLRMVRADQDRISRADEREKAAQRIVAVETKDYADVFAYADGWNQALYVAVAAARGEDTSHE